MRLIAWGAAAVLLGACGGSGSFQQSAQIGAPCDPTVTTAHPADCASPLVCTDPFGKGDECTSLYANGGCAPGTSAYTVPSSRLLICLPTCSNGTCPSGSTCQCDGACDSTSKVCVPN